MSEEYIRNILSEGPARIDAEFDFEGYDNYLHSVARVEQNTVMHRILRKNGFYLPSASSLPKSDIDYICNTLMEYQKK